MLEVHELECIRGDRKLISDLSFKLVPGELLHLRGKNGSGKTTLLRAICGLFDPSQGYIEWRGKRLKSFEEEYRAEILYLGHKAGINDDLSGEENLRFLADMRSLECSREQAWNSLSRMGLAGFEDLPCKVLSQGQKKRVSLAQLMLSNAALWLLDEPFTALDTDAIDVVQKVIAKHVEAGGMVLLTTHQEVEITSVRVSRLVLGGASYA
jgi:heme exporter protein A